MWSLVVVVRHVFTHREPEMAFAEQDELAQALALDGQDEPRPVRKYDPRAATRELGRSSHRTGRE